MTTSLHLIMNKNNHVQQQESAPNEMHALGIQGPAHLVQLSVFILVDWSTVVDGTPQSREVTQLHRPRLLKGIGNADDDDGKSEGKLAQVNIISRPVVFHRRSRNYSCFDSRKYYENQINDIS